MIPWADKDGMVEVRFDELVEESKLAILIKINDKKYWLPKSQVDFRGWSHIIEMPMWLAIEKELV